LKPVVDSILHVEGRTVDWVFHESLLENEHIATVALKSKDRTEDPPRYVAFKTLSFDELIKNLAQIEEEDQNDWLQFSSKKQKHRRTFSAMK